jgi:hypothetical protein
MKYIRYFWEINFDNTIHKKWIPYHNGGNFRKWFGNEEEVVDTSDKAIKFYREKGGYPNMDLVQEIGITWNLITSATNAFRLKEANFLYSSAAPTIVKKTDEKNLFFNTLAFLNSSPSKYLIQAVNPTLNTTVGDVLSLPYISANNEVKQVVEENVQLSKCDWDSYETSWDFKKHPLL